jgi:flagellar hook-associated protein 3 FlgL
MTTRISQSMMYRRFLDNLYKVDSRLDKTNERISTGRKINRPSDDPTYYTLITGLKKNMTENDQYLRNIQNAENFLSQSEEFVREMYDLTARVTELAVQGASEQYTAENRRALAADVESIRDEFISYLNHNSEGKYMFAGTETQTEPFDSAGNYYGNSDLVSLDVSLTASIPLNIPGDELVFGAGGQGSNDDVLQVMQDIIDGLNSDNTTAIDSALQNLDPIMERISNYISEIGHRRGRLDSFKSHYENLNIVLTKSLEDIESADYAEEITNYNQDTTIRNAALQSASRLQGNNLFDYLG